MAEMMSDFIVSADAATSAVMFETMAQTNQGDLAVNVLSEMSQTGDMETIATQNTEAFSTFTQNAFETASVENSETIAAVMTTTTDSAMNEMFYENLAETDNTSLVANVYTDVVMMDSTQMENVMENVMSSTNDQINDGQSSLATEFFETMVESNPSQVAMIAETDAEMFNDMVSAADPTNVAGTYYDPANGTGTETTTANGTGTAGTYDTGTGTYNAATGTYDNGTAETYNAETGTYDNGTAETYNTGTDDDDDNNSNDDQAYGYDCAGNYGPGYSCAAFTPKSYNGIMYYTQASYDAAVSGGGSSFEWNGTTYGSQATYDAARTLDGVMYTTVPMYNSRLSELEYNGTQYYTQADYDAASEGGESGTVTWSTAPTLGPLHQFYDLSFEATYSEDNSLNVNYDFSSFSLPSTMQTADIMSGIITGPDSSNLTAAEFDTTYNFLATATVYVGANPITSDAREFSFFIPEFNTYQTSPN